MNIYLTQLDREGEDVHTIYNTNNIVEDLDRIPNNPSSLWCSPFCLWVYIFIILFYMMLIDGDGIGTIYQCNNGSARDVMHAGVAVIIVQIAMRATCVGWLVYLFI